MLKIGNKIRMVKSMPMASLMKDMIFEITDIQDHTIALSSPFGFGFMSGDEFPKYFQRVRDWTPWVWSDNLEYRYRTDNEKYVDVMWNGKRATAACNPIDEFELNTGIAIALKKIMDKM